MVNRIKLFANSLITRVVVGGEEGQAMVEYGIILGLISVVAIALLATIGGDIAKGFEKIVEELTKAKL
jgi:Flp pilus assembly pilin Flp